MKKGILLVTIGLMIITTGFRVNGLDIIPDAAGVVPFALGALLLRSLHPKWRTVLLVSVGLAALSLVDVALGLQHQTNAVLSWAQLVCLVALIWVFCDAMLATFENHGLHELAGQARQRRNTFIIVRILLTLVAAAGLFFNVLVLLLILGVDLWFGWWLTAPLRELATLQHLLKEHTA